MRGMRAIFGFALILLTGNALADERIRAWREGHEAAVLEEFRALLAIPNVARDRENIEKNAGALVAALEKRGATARILRAGDAPPSVFGNLPAPGARRTILFYAHFDGQPVVASEWNSDPWVPVLRLDQKEVAFPKAGERVDPEARLYARSASDDKGPIIGMLAALDALKATGRRPAVNLKFFFEGEEEAGSDHLREILEENAGLLRGDLWLFCDGPAHQSRRAQIYFGARGVLGLEMTVYGPSRSLHSGHYGNWAPNPVALLASLLADMRAPDGRILIENFSSDVRPLTAAEKKAIAAVPAAEEQMKKELAIAQPESETSIPESITRPALNFHGVQSGSVGANASNSIPTTATVSIDFRLVPDQTPMRVKELVEAHLRKNGWHVVHEEPELKIRSANPRVVYLQWGSGYPPARTALDQPLAGSVVRAIESVTGEPLIQMPTLGGSVPMYLFDEVLKTPVIGVPTVNHDNNQHAANENIRLQNLWDSIEIFAALMTGFER